jgi:hypothetical protein
VVSAGRTVWDLFLRSALWFTLGVWIGAWLLFGIVVAPTAFRVLPSIEVAGSLVGPILAALHLYGAAAGGVLALLALFLRRGPVLIALPLLMGAVCLYSHFGVSAELSEIRHLAFGPRGNAEFAARFNQLHRLSMTLFISLGAAAVLLLVLHTWSDIAERRRKSARIS